MGRWVIPLILAGLIGAGQEAGIDRVRRSRLENGLTVLLRPVEGTGDVALVVLYSIGGDHDPEGRSGLAHLVEHLYVTAAAGEGEARTAQEYMQRYPLGWNAQTGDDYTVFATVFPKEALDEELEDAASRMGDLRVEAADLEREKERLLQEVSNMFGGLPALAARNLAGEKVRPTPLGGRKGGLGKDVEAITLEEVQRRWERLYKPANATLVLIGAFDPREADGVIARRLGPIPPGEAVPEHPAPGEPVLGGTEEVRVKSIVPNATGTACLAYRAPSPESDLYPAFLVLLTRMIRATMSWGGQPGQPRPVEVSFALLDDPAKIYVTGPVRKGESAEETVRRLETFVADRIAPDLQPGEAVGVRNLYGLFLWADSLGDPILVRNLYGVAFAIGRREQIGFDPGTIKETLGRLTSKEIHAAGKSVFSRERAGAVIAHPK